MVFSDIFFLFCFLPIFLIFYFAAADIRVKNIVLVLFSLFFYSWGEPFWIVLLIISSILDVLNGRWITHHKDEKIAVLGVISSCVVDLGILAVFKYSGFFMSTVNSVTGLSLPVPEFHLPIGISFYTFQSITYVVDVYRGKKAQTNYFGYLLYLSMFFQLVAGPIVRYGDVAREIDRREITTHGFAEGLCRLMYGLGKKVIIADSVGKIAEQCLTFGDAPVSVLAAWAGVIMYSLQIYFDFSGYSDMAIGMGLMCGFTFPENFDHPYASKSVTEFWRRWHISLGTFFRDYVYIPLGGNRRHQMINILVVWALTGLWHGASGNFVLWGLYFALFLVLEKKYLLSFFKSVPAVFGHIYTLIVAVFGWAIFYFTDLGKLLTCLKSMFGAGGLPMTDMVTESTLKGNIFIIAAALLLCAPVYPKLKQLVDKLCGNTITFTVYGLCKIVFLMGIFLLSAVSLVGDTYSPFLYFRF